MGWTSKPQDIYDTARPMILVGWISGLGPFRVMTTPNQEKIPRFSPFGLLLSILHIFGYAYCLFETIKKGESFNSYFIKSSVVVVDDFLQLLVSTTCFLTIYVSSLKNWRKIPELVKFVDIADKKLAKLGYPLEFGKMLRWGYICAIFVLGSSVNFLVISVYITSTWLKAFGFIAYMAHFLPHLMLAFITIMFASMPKTMFYRMECVNKVPK